MSQILGKTMKCPFDPSHVMPHERFLNHLEKCKFADKKSYLKCRFNPYHVIHRDLIDKHEGECEDGLKYKVESDDDSWGAEPEAEPEKPEKSTVSTSLTASTSNCRANKKEVQNELKKEVKSSKKVESKHDPNDFDDYDFSGTSKGGK